MQSECQVAIGACGIYVRSGTVVHIVCALVWSAFLRKHTAFCNYIFVVCFSTRLIALSTLQQ